MRLPGLPALGVALMSLGACADTGSLPVSSPAPAPGLLPKAAFVDDVLLTGTSPLASPSIEQAPERLPDPDRLNGLSPAEVQAMISPVSLISRMEDAQVIQFLNPTCVLDIYFYESAPGEGFAANHVSARDREGNDVAVANCLASLLPADSWPDGAAARLMPNRPPVPSPESPSNLERETNTAAGQY